LRHATIVDTYHADARRGSAFGFAPGAVAATLFN